MVNSETVRILSTYVKSGDKIVTRHYAGEVADTFKVDDVQVVGRHVHYINENTGEILCKKSDQTVEILNPLKSHNCVWERRVSIE